MLFAIAVIPSYKGQQQLHWAQRPQSCLKKAQYTESKFKDMKNRQQQQLHPQVLCV